jgi:hypothetical protein
MTWPLQLRHALRTWWQGLRRQPELFHRLLAQRFDRKNPPR